MRTLLTAKLFFYILFIGVLFLLFMIIVDIRSKPQRIFTDYRDVSKWFMSKVQNRSREHFMKLHKKPKLKYILQWTSANSAPFIDMGQGREGFTSRKCPHTNCYVTSNRSLLDDIRKFDAITFCGTKIRYYNKRMLPQTRSPHQKYVFGTTESSHYYPICTNQFDNYFNWTWTFRLDSDVRWGDILVKDKNNNIIGPNKRMHWLRPYEMDPVSEQFKKKLKTKKKAAAWFVSKCNDRSGGTIVAFNLKKELEKNYNLTVDIYGACGPLKCPSKDIKDCLKMLQDDYYFYLSFENSFSEDYVTENFLKAVINNVVPIVYGGANYSRFVPDGAYLNAKEMTVHQLAAKMDGLIKNLDQYADYFRWTNHYSYHSNNEDPKTDGYCRFCEVLNDESKVNKVSHIGDFRKWWNNPDFCKRFRF